jgi:hypothetical protein
MALLYFPIPSNIFPAHCVDTEVVFKSNTAFPLLFSFYASIRVVSALLTIIFVISL